LEEDLDTMEMPAEEKAIEGCDDSFFVDEEEEISIDLNSQVKTESYDRALSYEVSGTEEVAEQGNRTYYKLLIG
ncbi:MAG: hypothetical protein J5972_03585, partial [Eubacterium sp.]|nr:hypothetical protein [Eubacterium sp.]